MDDQCSYISKDQAIKAIARLNINEDIYFLCEFCSVSPLLPKDETVEQNSENEVKNYHEGS